MNEIFHFSDNLKLQKNSFVDFLLDPLPSFFLSFFLLIYPPTPVDLSQTSTTAAAEMGKELGPESTNTDVKDNAPARLF